MEQDSWVTCPYDKVHKVPKSRIQGHIVKCQKRYPQLSICPYNATHRMPQEELGEHVLTCPTKALNFTDLKTAKIVAPRTTISKKEKCYETDPTHEFWD